MKPEKVKLANLKRISIVGSSCSGKTTFGRNLAQILKIKYVELDAINWLPDWVERPKDEFITLVERAAAEETWVFDGNYTRTREIVWRRATAIIWLNYSFPRTFYRAMNRTTRRVLTGEKIYSGNQETFRQAFMSRDSILWWVLTTYFEKRRRYTKLIHKDNFEEKEIFIFRHPKEAEEFLARLEQVKF